MQPRIAGMTRLPGRCAALAAAAAVAAGVAGLSGAPAQAQTPLRAGVPTIVDPIRGGAEPYIAVGTAGDTWISAPGGTSTQTSWFWRSRDQGQSYTLAGPSGGHWICNGQNGQPPLGGGDSHLLVDHMTGQVYYVDQEGLASLGFGRSDAGGKNLTSSCLAAPDVSADRPFQALLHPGAGAPQSAADGGKTLVYLSFLCAACGAVAPNGPGALVFGWSDDGTTFHNADPGSGPDLPLTNTALDTPTVTAFGGHGPMVADSSNGYVYTPISCTGACPNGDTVNEFGIVVGAPGSNTSNIGQFASETYVPAAVDGKNGAKISQGGILFPNLTVDSAGTLYLGWVSGSGSSTSSTPPADSLHFTYVYSKDRAHHYPTSSWSKPNIIDRAPSQSVGFPWLVAGDPGHLGAVWMGSNLRQYPSQVDAAKQWHPFMAVSTNADTPSPSFQQTQVGVGPNHLSDVCLQGTIGCAVVCVPSVTDPCPHGGNRNMADFISCDIGQDGALQMTWANDSNELRTNPDSAIPGLPLTEFAKQIAGPRLIGQGDVSDARFPTVSQPLGVSAAIGGAIFDAATGRVDQGVNIPQLDIVGSHVESSGSNLVIHVPVADLSTLSSPSSSKSNVWWLTTWQYNHTIYFAKAQVNSGGTPSFAAGLPASYDRPALGTQTAPTLVDYSGGTTVQGTKNGNEWVITVPSSLVGSPANGALLEAVTSFSVLDNGNRPVVTVGVDGLPIDNVPTVVKATAAYDYIVGSTEASTGTLGSGTAGSTTLPTPNTSSAGARPLAAGAAVLLLVGCWGVARRRRRSA